MSDSMSKFEEWFAAIWAGSEDVPVPAWQGPGWDTYIEKRQLSLGAWDAATSSLRQVPEGWVLVPREPTPEMVSAATSCATTMKGAWRAMVDVVESANPATPTSGKAQDSCAECPSPGSCDGKCHGGTSATPAQAGAELPEVGMLPTELLPYADEWYRLCERRFAVDRITISGELAEAIVAAIDGPARRGGSDE